MANTRSTRELLTDYTVLLNKHGVKSVEAQEFLDENRENEEFIELAELTKTLKEALTCPTSRERHGVNTMD
jgi:hypothetical protein